MVVCTYSVLNPNVNIIHKIMTIMIHIIMSTHDGYYKQVDGLAMGSPPAPHLANG